MVHTIKGNNQKPGARTKAVPEPSNNDSEREAKRAKPSPLMVTDAEAV